MSDSISTAAPIASSDVLNVPQFLKDLLSLDPVAAYPVASWCEHAHSLLNQLDPNDCEVLARAYGSQAIPTDRKERSELRRVLEHLRSFESFDTLESKVEAYEKEHFCRFEDAEFCIRCGMRTRGWQHLSPLCTGLQVEEPVNTVETFASDALDNFGLEYDPGAVGTFEYHAVLDGTPVLVWQSHRNAPVSAAMLAAILKRAERNGLSHLFLILDEDEASALPLVVSGHISYNILGLPSRRKKSLSA